MKDYLKHAPEFELTGEADSIKNACNQIRQLQPDLLLLDVQLQDGTGFELLDYFPNPKFEVIFTTAYDEFAVKAFKYAAIDYLLKPIVAREFLQSIEKYPNSTQHNQLQHLVQSLQGFKQAQHFEKLALSTSEGLIMIELKNIFRLEADKAYTTFHMQNGEQHVASKNIKQYENLLPNEDFFRIHASHLVNLHFVKKYLRNEGGKVILKNSIELPIARRRKEEFLEKLKTMGLN